MPTTRNGDDRPAWPATEQQIGLIRALLAEREVPDRLDFLATVEDSIDNGTLAHWYAGHQLIPTLRRLPYTPQALADRRPPLAATDRVIPTNAARAVGRFNPDGPTGYTSSLGGPIRATRAEAVQDYTTQLDG